MNIVIFDTCWDKNLNDKIILKFHEHIYISQNIKEVSESQAF